MAVSLPKSLHWSLQLLHSCCLLTFLLVVNFLSVFYAQYLFKHWQCHIIAWKVDIETEHFSSEDFISWLYSWPQITESEQTLVLIKRMSGWGWNVSDIEWGGLWLIVGNIWSLPDGADLGLVLKTSDYTLCSIWTLRCVDIHLLVRSLLRQKGDLATAQLQVN